MSELVTILIIGTMLLAIGMGVVTAVFLGPMWWRYVRGGWKREVSEWKEVTE